MTMTLLDAPVLASPSADAIAPSRTRDPAAQPTRRQALPPSTGTVQIIGVPMDLGASQRGVDMGPSAMRLANVSGQLGKLGLTVHDVGNVSVPDRTFISADLDSRLSAIAEVCVEVARRTAK